MKFKIALLLLFIAPFLFSQELQPKDEEIEINKFIQGSLMVPASEVKPPLVIMIAGSGPTDRNGNQSFMKNNSFKKLAEGLWEQGIATFRYDKRVLHAQRLGITEEEMRFDDLITDAISAINFFEEKGKFNKIIILGHSQGSLVGMLSTKDKADAFISIAGAGQPLDSIIVDQIAQQMPGLKENTRQALMELRENGSTTSYNPMLGSIFRPSVQPFLLSWILYNPAEEIAKLDIPALIINGTNDFQVPQVEAELLKTANPNSKLVLLENMNHVLKEIEGKDDLENSKSYNEPNRPLHTQLIPTIVTFIKELE